MKIRFTENCEIQVILTINEELDDIENFNESFKICDVVEVDVLEEHAEKIDVQFGDGSVTYGLPKNCFEEVLESRQREYHGWYIVGHQDYAFAVNMENNKDIHYFDRDPNVNDDAFIRACGWAFPGKEIE